MFIREPSPTSLTYTNSYEQQLKRGTALRAAVAQHLRAMKKATRVDMTNLGQYHTPSCSAAAEQSFNGQVAQLVEQRTENPCVGGSTPSLAINKISALDRAGSQNARPVPFIVP
jgi:hypothetical protein